MAVSSEEDASALPRSVRAGARELYLFFLAFVLPLDFPFSRLIPVRVFLDYGIISSWISPDIAGAISYPIEAPTQLYGIGERKGP